MNARAQHLKELQRQKELRKLAAKLGKAAGQIVIPVWTPPPVLELDLHIKTQLDEAFDVLTYEGENFQRARGDFLERIQHMPSKYAGFVIEYLDGKARTHPSLQHVIGAATRVARSLTKAPQREFKPALVY